MTKYRVLTAAAALLLLGGCRGTARPANAGIEGGVSIRETVTVADPQAAVDEIYETLPEARTEPLTDYHIGKHFEEAADKIDEYYGCISNPNGGLADVIILGPAEGAQDEVRDALHQYQERRIREFENYDILGSFDIAKNAVVIDQGSYVILLMLPDNDAAQDILDRHLPL